MKAAYIGFGGMGQQIANLVRTVLKPEEEIYFDDSLVKAGKAGAYPFGEYLNDQFADCAFFIGLAYKQPAAKRRILHELLAKGRNVPSLIHPTSHVDPSARLASGVVIYPLCVIDINVSIEAGTVIHNNVTVSHDSTVGECCFLSPSVTLCGRVTLGAESFLGAGALVANDLTIANNAVIGMGTVVSRNVEAPSSSVIGNPMKVLDKALRF